MRKLRRKVSCLTILTSESQWRTASSQGAEKRRKRPQVMPDEQVDRPSFPGSEGEVIPEKKLLWEKLSGIVNRLVKRNR